MAKQCFVFLASYLHPTQDISIDHRELLKAVKTLTLTCRQPSGLLRRDFGDDRQVQLTVQGFNANRMTSVLSLGQSSASATQSNQVNILNLPLPDSQHEEGNKPVVGGTYTSRS